MTNFSFTFDCHSVAGLHLCSSEATACWKETARETTRVRDLEKRWMLCVYSSFPGCFTTEAPTLTISSSMWITVSCGVDRTVWFNRHSVCVCKFDIVNIVSILYRIVLLPAFGQTVMMLPSLSELQSQLSVSSPSQMHSMTVVLQMGKMQ